MKIEPIHCLAINEKKALIHEKFADIPLRIKTRKIGKTNLLQRAKTWLADRIMGRKWIEAKIGDSSLNLEVNQLAEALGISKGHIETAIESNSLDDLIEKACEAKHYHVNFSVFENNDISKIRELERKADELHLPLQELIEAKQRHYLPEVLARAQKVEENCQRTFANLDKIFGSQGEKIAIKNPKGGIEVGLEMEDLAKLKDIVRSAFKVMAAIPQEGSNDPKKTILQVTSNLYLEAVSNGSNLTITSLFGKLLGSGVYGAAAQRIELINAAFVDGNESVIKIPTPFEMSNEQAQHEVYILDKIHDEGAVLGIQKKLKLVKDLFTGVSTCCHLGPKYDSNLRNLIETENSQTTDQKHSIAFQLAHGITYIHSKGITNGDIKPENIFISEDPQLSFKAYIADFGGALEHVGNVPPPQETVTPEYRTSEDSKKANNAYEQKDFQKYFQIERKADIFALSACLCETFLNKYPFKEYLNDSKGDIRLIENLESQLTQNGASLELASLLVKSLDPDYKKRPSVEVILEQIKRDLNESNPELFQKLEALSVC